MADNNNVLKLYKGEAHKIRVEKAEEFKDSYFLDAYRQALRCFYDIHVDNETTRKNKSNREFNNVIAFCGERGSGKTSAMMSFRDMLADWENQHNHITTWAGEDFAEKTPKGMQFVCLEAVDPSRFEPNDRLSGTVLSELYRRYSENERKDRKERHENLDIQRKLEKAFVDLLRGIQLLSVRGQSPFGDPESPESEFEVLKRIAGAAGLRKTFHELVQNYLRYDLNLGADVDLRDAYLVIPVDDLDLSVEHAFNLAEDIRKYLHVPNVIILIAMKLEQLGLAVEQENLVRFKQSRKDPLYARPSIQYIEDMAVMYLEKLIPLPRRILLPSWGELQQLKQLKIYFGVRKHDNENIESVNAEKLLLHKIKSKTLLYFRTNPGFLTPMMPRTIRELQNFLEFLDELPTVPNKTETGPLSIPGLEVFKNYFFGTWVPGNLSTEEEEILGRIMETDFSQKNAVATYELAKIVTSLRDELSKLDPTKTPTTKSSNSGSSTSGVGTNKPLKYSEDLISIVYVDNYSFNLSLGDTRLYTMELERLDLSRKYSKLLFAIRTYFSFEIVTQIIIRSNIELEKKGNDNLSDLIGGMITHPKEIQIMPTPKGKYSSVYRPTDAQDKSTEQTLVFDRLRIDTKYKTKSDSKSKVIELIRQHIKEKYQVNEAQNTDEPPMGGRIPVDNETLLSFFSFVYFGEDATNKNYRTKDFRWYLQTPNFFGSKQGRNSSYFMIDFKSIFFWALFPEINIFRISGKASDKYLFEDDENEESDGPSAKSSKSEDFSVEIPKLQYGFIAHIFQFETISTILRNMEIAGRKKWKETYSRSFEEDIRTFYEFLEVALSKEWEAFTLDASDEKINDFSDQIQATDEPIVLIEKSKELNLETVFPWVFSRKDQVIETAKYLSDLIFKA